MLLMSIIKKADVLDSVKNGWKSRKIPGTVSSDLSTEEHFFMIKHQDLVFINGVPTSDSLERVIDEMWLDFIKFVKNNKSLSLNSRFLS